jgi:hypothetical protein
LQQCPDFRLVCYNFVVGSDCVALLETAMRMQRFAQATFKQMIGWAVSIAVARCMREDKFALKIFSRGKAR